MGDSMSQLPELFVLMVFGAGASLYLARTSRSKPTIYAIGVASLLAQIGIFMAAHG
jgi:hypothetical protein